MAKTYIITYAIDGQIIYTDKAFLTREEVKALEAEGMVVKVA